MSRACIHTCIKIIGCRNTKNTLQCLPLIGLRYVFASAPCRKESSPKSNAMSLIQFNKENLRLYGPLLKSKKHNKAQAKKTLDSHSLDSDSSAIKQKVKAVKKPSGYPEVTTEKPEQTTMETVEVSSKKKLKKSKEYSSKLPDSSSLGAIPFSGKWNESFGELALPKNWQEVLNDFIAKQPLTVSDCDSFHNNMAYKNILNLFSIKTLPSVTSILNKTLPPISKLLLQRWKAKMIQEMGPMKFQKYQEELKMNGSNFHSYIQKILAEEDVKESSLHLANEGHWQSLKTLLPRVTNVRALETDITHQGLLYRGKFDCVARYDNHLCLIDWKTSLKHKPLIANTYDNPIQVAAYISALNTSLLLDVQVTSAMIVIAYPDGSQADVHFMDEKLCEHYWNEWKQRLLEFWILFGSQK